jgi:phospholipid/cholesterol/gamma-HCH transport system substrate-binding protein
MAKGEAWAESAIGAAVLAAAAGFLWYTLSNASPSVGQGGYSLTARFGEVGGLATGADVRVSGVKVGTVAKITLDPKSFLAVTTLNLNGDVKLPADSTAKISSTSLLGGAMVAITPGGSTQDLKPGGEIENTQGAVDLFNLIGQVVRGGADGAKKGEAAADAQSGDKVGLKPAAPKPAADPYPG